MLVFPVSTSDDVHGNVTEMYERFVLSHSLSWQCCDYYYCQRSVCANLYIIDCVMRIYSRANSFSSMKMNRKSFRSKIKSSKFVAVLNEIFLIEHFYTLWILDQKSKNRAIFDRLNFGKTDSRGVKKKKISGKSVTLIYRFFFAFFPLFIENCFWNIRSQRR